MSIKTKSKYCVDIWNGSKFMTTDFYHIVDAMNHTKKYVGYGKVTVYKLVNKEYQEFKVDKSHLKDD